VITLEGGYSISGQRQSVKAVLEELVQTSPSNKKDLVEKEKEEFFRVERLVHQLKEIQKRYWKSL
jgi:acetoin utilization deacetylase AcuC-like enzyme